MSGHRDREPSRDSLVRCLRRSRRACSVRGRNIETPNNGITNRCRNELFAAFALALAGIAGSASAQIIVQAADIIADTTWGDNETEVVLQQPIFVKSGATLTILPGTIVRGQPRTGPVVAGLDARHARCAHRHPDRQDHRRRRRRQPDHHDDGRGRQQQRRHRRRRRRADRLRGRVGCRATSSSTTPRPPRRSHRSTRRASRTSRSGAAS